MRQNRNIIGDWWLALIAALQFLTRLPLSTKLPNAPAIFRRSVVFFPVAGLLVGVVVAGIGYGLSFILPAYVNAPLLLIIWVLLTGGLHMDGLMDTADGLLSHRSRERMLEIMKDSHVGAMGVIVGILTLLLKLMLLIALFGEAGAATAADSARDTGIDIERLLVLAVIPIWSRAFMVMAIAGWPYAREGHGMGNLFRSVRGRHAISAGLLSALLSLGVFLLFVIAGASFTMVLAWIGCIALLTYIGGSWMASAISRKLGGLTGDVYGALNELLEVMLLLAAVVYFLM